MKTPMNLPADFKITLQPMMHVAALGPAIDFYEALGGRLVYGSRDGDWALVAVGGGSLSLLAHPPSEQDTPVEIQFTSATPLEAIEQHVAATMPHAIARGTADEMFGRMLQLRTPDGMIVKLLELERDLIE